MDAQALLRSGKLDDAQAAVQNDVRQHPADSRHRVFLFQILCARGEWDRALNQLDVLEGLDASNLPLVRTYSTAIQCEGVRSEVFQGRRSPLVFGDPVQWLALLLESNRLLTEGKVAQAETIRGEALEAAPATAGAIDGQPFDWIMDADPRLGPVCELILNGKYYWAPFDRIRKITFEAPADLRDIIWLPASFVWANGGETAGLVPARYPGTETADDPMVVLSRRTDWESLSAGTQLGVGQRLLATSADDFALLDTREIVLEPVT